MSEDMPLLDAPPAASSIHAVRSFLVCLCLLFSFPYAASTIAVYDVLYNSACSYYSIPADQCLSAPEPTQFVTSLFAVVSILNAVLATAVLVITTIMSDRKGGRERGLVWFMALCAMAVISFPVLSYFVDSSTTTPWRMIVPYVFFALSGTPTLLLNLSMLHITDLVTEPGLRIKSLSLLVGFAMLTQAFAPGMGSTLLKCGVSLHAFMAVCGIWMAIGTFVFAYNLRNPVMPTNSDTQELFPEVPTSEDNASINSDNANAIVSKFSRKQLLHKLGIYDFLGVMKSRNAIIVTLNFILSNELAIGIMDLIMVYGKRSFGWTGPKVGQTQFMLFAVRMLWALVGFPLLYSSLTRIWPAHPDEVDNADLVHMVLCNVITVVAYSIMATASNSSQYTTGIFLLANDGIVGTVWINSLIKHVPITKKGAFMGALSLVNKPMGAILPAVFMKVLQHTTESNPSTVLWVISGVAVLLTVSLVFIKTARPVVLS